VGEIHVLRLWGSLGAPAVRTLGKPKLENHGGLGAEPEENTPQQQRERGHEHRDQQRRRRVPLHTATVLDECGAFRSLTALQAEVRQRFIRKQV